MVVKERFRGHVGKGGTVQGASWQGDTGARGLVGARLRRALLQFRAPRSVAPTQAIQG